MQSGKTGTFLCALSLYKNYLERFEAYPNFYYLTLSDKELIKQTIKDSKSSNINIKLEGNSFHSGTFKEFIKAFDKTANNVIVLDESHHGIGYDQKLSSILKEIGINLDNNPSSWTCERTSIITISATPYTQIGSKSRSFAKMVTLGVDKKKYLSVEKLMSSGKIRTSEELLDGNKLSGTLTYILDDFRFKAPSYMLLRVHGGKFDKVIKLIEKQYKTIEIKQLIQETDTNVDFLQNKPSKATLVILKNALRVGRRVDTTHISYMYDTAKKQSDNTDTVNQSFLGRACGYGKNPEVIILTNPIQAQNYIDNRKSNYQNGNHKTKNSSKVMEKKSTEFVIVDKTQKTEYAKLVKEQLAIIKQMKDEGTDYKGNRKVHISRWKDKGKVLPAFNALIKKYKAGSIGRIKKDSIGSFGRFGHSRELGFDECKKLFGMDIAILSFPIKGLSVNSKDTLYTNKYST